MTACETIMWNLKGNCVFLKCECSQASWKTPLKVFVLLGLMQFCEICVTLFSDVFYPSQNVEKSELPPLAKDHFSVNLDQLDGHDYLRNPWRGTNGYDVFEPNKNTNTISLYIKHAKTPLIGALCLKLWNPIIELDWRFIKSCGRKTVGKSASPIPSNEAVFCQSVVTPLTDSGRPVQVQKTLNSEVPLPSNAHLTSIYIYP